MRYHAMTAAPRAREAWRKQLVMFMLFAAVFRVRELEICTMIGCGLDAVLGSCEQACDVKLSSTFFQLVHHVAHPTTHYMD